MANEECGRWNLLATLQVSQSSTLPSVRAIHGSYLAGHVYPFKFSFWGATGKGLLKLQQLIHEPQVGLDDDIETTGPDITTNPRVSPSQIRAVSSCLHLLRAGKRKFKGPHNFGNTYSSRSRDAHPAVNQYWFTKTVSLV
jgi:hypothetical protein